MINASRGFTLIQILIIMGILGVLATVAVVLIDPIAQIQKANDNKRKSDLLQIQKALLRYYKDFGKFPPSPGNCLQDVNNCKIVRLDGKTVEWGESFAPYINILPQDPSKNKAYVYYVKTDRQTYYLYASLDGGQDLQACHLDGSACNSIITNGIDPNACRGICNYAVSSENVTP